MASSSVQPLSEVSIKKLGKTINSYWHLFAYAQLGEFALFALWHTLHSPFTCRDLSSWELLNRFQWSDYITQGILALGWGVYLYFLIILLWPMIKNLHKSHYFMKMKIAWGFIILGTLLQIFQVIFKLINYIQVYAYIREVASSITPNLTEMYGLLLGTTAMMNISSFLNIIPSGILFLGILAAYTWGRSMAKSQIGKSSLSDCEKGFLIALAGAALMLLRTIFDLHPTFPVIWTWIFGVLGIVLGLKKVVECLEIFSEK
ncbi:MAG: hypothetical protein ACTSYI_02420 [Promethearchaeota archaeon]